MTSDTDKARYKQERREFDRKVEILKGKEDGPKTETKIVGGGARPIDKPEIKKSGN